MCTHIFAALALKVAVFEEILRCSNCSPDCLALCLNQFIDLRRFNSFVLAHRVERSLSSDSQRMDRGRVFFLKPERYCGFEVSACCSAARKYKQLRETLKTAHASLFLITIPFPGDP
jgi:hypothetical protein